MQLQLTGKSTHKFIKLLQ